MNTKEEIISKIESIPPESLDKLKKFIDSLVNPQSPNSGRKFNQKWAGGLKDLKISSVDLQKKSMEWR